MVLSFRALFLPFSADVSLYFFYHFFKKQNRLGFKKIIEIKILDKSIVSKKKKKTSYGRIAIQIYLRMKKNTYSREKKKLR